MEDNEAVPVSPSNQIHEPLPVNNTHLRFVLLYHHWSVNRWCVGLPVSKHGPLVGRLWNFTHRPTVGVVVVMGDVTVAGLTVGCAGTVMYSRTLYYNFVCLISFFFTQTTGARAKPEEEKENEVESRTFGELPQVPLCHIVTPLVPSVRQCRTDLNTPTTQIWIPWKELTVAVNPRSTKMMDGERSESEQSAPHDAFEWCRPPLHYLCCLSRTFNRPCSEATLKSFLISCHLWL